MATAGDTREIDSERGLKDVSEVGEEFYERLSQKACLSLEHPTRYARHVGDVLDVVVRRRKLSPKYWELPERVLPYPRHDGSYEQRPGSLTPSDAPVPNG